MQNLSTCKADCVINEQIILSCPQAARRPFPRLRHSSQLHSFLYWLDWATLHEAGALWDGKMMRLVLPLVFSGEF